MDGELCGCQDVLVVKNLNRWFKEKWVDVSRTNKDGSHPPCGRSKANKSSKGYPKCRPSRRVSSKTPKLARHHTKGEKQAMTQRKRSKKQGVGGKPTMVKGDPMDVAWQLLKRQTKLYNWIPDYPGQPPIQQISAQPLEHLADYMEGKYPKEFWSMIGDDPSGADTHGASRWRADPEGNYVAVGIRGDEPIGDLPTTGPARNVKDGAGVRVVGEQSMPDPSRIVVMPRNVAHKPQFDRKAIEKLIADKRRRIRG